MDVIPVIDLKGGVVVHARGGRRNDYRPIETRLSPTSAPDDVIAGLLRVAPFRKFYVADLDAIARRGEHGDVLRGLAAGRPGIEFWVDNGAASADAIEHSLAGLGGSVVIGSESQPDTAMLRRVRDHSRVLLSLDFRGEGFCGADDILADARLWPRRVIVMTLARVGAASGPDLDRVAAIIRRAGDRRVYAAGGVRDGDDLKRLADIGAAGVLVATALHEGRITEADISAIARPEDRATSGGATTTP